jgi:DNA-binding FadR family transcriptional regulator
MDVPIGKHRAADVIVEDIRSKIVGGALSHGARLPSERDAAGPECHGVARRSRISRKRSGSVRLL